LIFVDNRRLYKENKKKEAEKKKQDDQSINILLSMYFKTGFYLSHKIIEFIR